IQHMPPDKTTDTGSLRDILRLECKKGYTNRAVIGGMDKYLHRQAGPIRQSLNNRRLLTSFNELNLVNSNYDSWSVDERRKWIAHAFEWLNTAERTNRKNAATLQPKGSPTIGTGAVTSPEARPEEKLPIVRQRSPAEKHDGLNSPITVIRGIAPKVATKFSKLGVSTVNDLLYFFPRRYIDYSQRRPIAEIEEGKDQTIMATIWQSRVTTLGSRVGTEAIVGDETGNVRIVWFNQPYLARNFPTNARVVISGTVGIFKGQKVFESPEWELLKGKELIHTGRLVPVYPLTQGLYPRQVRKWTKEAVDGWAWQLQDFMPPEIKTRCQLLNLSEAIAQVHYPDDQLRAQKAQERLAFDELLLLQLGVLARKRDWQEGQPGNPFEIHTELIDKFLRCLPFTLTGAQERVLQEILADLQQTRAMSRLLQGEVGSGKTVIAILTLLMAVANGFQGTLMAPTEVLAEQHFNNICRFLLRGSSQTGPREGRLRKTEETNRKAPAVPIQTGNVHCYTGFLSQPLTIALLIGSLSDAEKEDLHYKIESGEIDITIGTHALIQRDVQFHRLGLAVIDEQQRFGVLQRSALRQKGFNPHILIMTATPIPRTMALTLYGDLDLSVITDLPPGRQVVKTKYL
ncbi:MAG: DEAD/DEAH box helicase, partial [Chloroflexota bacterium]|nr:DEAD/DEAH box helicase [Chloroflexota bacterium]